MAEARLSVRDFKGAKFIYVVRDGRAVVNSQVGYHFWNGWSGPENGSWGELSPARKEEWDRYGRSFVVLAAIQWKVLMDVMESAKTSLRKENFLELKYEDLCSDPLDTFRTVTEFCELKWTAELGRDRKTQAKERERQSQARPHCPATEGP